MHVLPSLYYSIREMFIIQHQINCIWSHLLHNVSTLYSNGFRNGTPWLKLDQGMKLLTMHWRECRSVSIAFTCIAFSFFLLNRCMSYITFSSNSGTFFMSLETYVYTSHHAHPASNKAACFLLEPFVLYSYPILSWPYWSTIGIPSFYHLIEKHPAISCSPFMSPKSLYI